MPEYLYPGVYVEEVDTGNKPIEGVSTSTVGFLGVAERGPDIPRLVTSYSEYVRMFGRYYSDPASQERRYLAHGIEGFFQNGGKRAFVQRVFRSGGVAAARDDDNMRITAVGKGLWGNRVGIKLTHNPDGTFNLTVMYWTEAPPEPIVDPTSRKPDDLRDQNRREPQTLEEFTDLSINPNSTAHFERQVNDVSNLIVVEKTGDALPAAIDAPELLADGDDGGELVLDDYRGDPEDAPGTKRGLDALNEIDEISLLCCPDEHDLDNFQIGRELVIQAERRKDRFAILSSPQKPPRPGQHIVDAGLISKYAAYYYPWFYVLDPLSGKKIEIPPAGHIAGIYARSDTERGVHKDPANEIIRGIDSLQVQLTNEQQALLNPIGINASRYFRGAGNLVWGGRTTTRDPDWKYINVRRLFIFIEKSIERATQWVVFEINDEPLWARVRRTIGDFLGLLWMQGMLQGRTREEAYFVRCDRTTMTQLDIDNGRLICVIGIAPVKPAEFVIFRIGQWTGGSEIQEQ
jgi:uncharacterized protein